MQTMILSIYKGIQATENNQFTRSIISTLVCTSKHTMKISIYLSVLFIALATKIVTANVRLQRSPQQYCGSRLADMLKFLCQTKYNEKKVKKNPMDSEILDYKDLEDYNAIDYPYQSKQDSMSFMPPRLLRSPKAKIIDECCYKPCYITELQGYCAN